VLNFEQYKFQMHTENGVLLQEEDANRKGREGEGWESRIRETLFIAPKEKLKPECWLPGNASGTSISSNCVATPMRCYRWFH
jgi:hypothetical protein